MKKLLLSMALMLVAAISAFATTDGQTYEAVNGYKLVNMWIQDRVHTPDTWKNADYCNTRARTAVLCNGVVYISRSEAIATIVPKADGSGNDTISQSVIYRLDGKTGQQLSTLNLTLNGSPYGVFLGVASIGKDNFGHIWVAPMTSNVAAKVPIYQVNTETGEMTLIQELTKGDCLNRTDYLDVMGDITRKEAECNIMTIGNAVATPGSPTIYRWHADKGATVFEGGFDGDPYINCTSFYPETTTGFSLAPVVKMCLSEEEGAEYAAELFYIDSFDGFPVLYDVSGSVIDSYEEVPNDLRPQTSPNGCAEFKIDDKYMFTYVIGQYDGDGHGCQANIVELGEGQSLGGMKKYWQIPADSLGKVSDTGLRVHSLCAEKSVEDGQEVATIMTFKSYNGVAVYKMGKGVKPGEDPTGVKGDVNGDGKVDTSDLSALMTVILSNGSATDNPKADVNGDGKVDTTDLSTLMTIILGA